MEFNDVRFNTDAEEMFNAMKNRLESNIYNAVIKTFVKYPGAKIKHESFARNLCSKAVLMLQQEYEKR